MAKQGEKIIESYLKKRGLFPRKIKERATKTPDFEVYNNDNLLFYCEEKTLEYIEFEGSMEDKSEETIKRQFRKAVKQFSTVNVEHELPNVLVFNNYDPMKNPQDLYIMVTGHTITEENKIIKLHNVGRIEDKLELIDLFIWFEKGEYVNHIWSGLNKEHQNSLNSIFPDFK